MKAFLYKMKSVVALTLAMTMFCPQVFAAEALSAAEQGVQEAPAVEKTPEEILAEATPTLTVEEALAKAMKHSPDLKDLEDSLELLEDNDEKLYDRVGSVKIPDYDYRRWASDSAYKLVTTVFQLEQNMDKVKLSRELQELILEMTVRTYFQTILSMEDTVELLRESAQMQQKTYEQGQTKYRLGMLSKYNLEQQQITAQKAKDTLTMTESALEQVYITFNSLIGENSDERFEFVYEVTFEPFEMTQTMDNYIRDKMNDDIMLKMQEMTVEAAKFNANYRAENEVGTYESEKLTYDQERRALKTAREEKETLIRNTYLQIKSLETEYESAMADLNKAQADYRVAQLSYQTGTVTKMAVEGAAMGVTQAENALKSLVYEHDMLVYKFNNPSVLSNTKAAQ